MGEFQIDIKEFIGHEWCELKNKKFVHALGDKEIEITDVPTLIIGIGGTGVNVAKVTKKKIEQQYHPSVAKKMEYLFIDTDGSSVSDVRGSDKRVIQSANTAILLREYKEQLKQGNVSQQGAANPILPREITEWQETKVKVHLFTGISGGTGSGIFVDICYVIRNINATCQVQGFGFMPDVSCMKKGLHDIHRRNIKRNGFAALCEIEQLMTLEQYGEPFHQKYPGNVPHVSSLFPIFDFCVIIGSKQDGCKALASEDEVLDRVIEYLLLELNKHKPGIFGFESFKSNLENKSDERGCYFCTKYASVGANVWYLTIDYYSLWLNDVFQMIYNGLENSNVNALTSEIGKNREKCLAKHECDVPPFYIKKSKKLKGFKMIETIVDDLRTCPHRKKVL